MSLLIFLNAGMPHDGLRVSGSRLVNDFTTDQSRILNHMAIGIDRKAISEFLQINYRSILGFFFFFFYSNRSYITIANLKR